MKGMRTFNIYTREIHSLEKKVSLLRIVIEGVSEPQRHDMILRIEKLYGELQHIKNNIDKVIQQGISVWMQVHDTFASTLEEVNATYEELQHEISQELLRKEKD